MLETGLELAADLFDVQDAQSNAHQLKWLIHRAGLFASFIWTHLSLVAVQKGVQSLHEEREPRAGLQESAQEPPKLTFAQIECQGM